MPNETKTESGHCPICGKDTVHEYRPFCSKMCADIDLGRWLKGIYATPSVDQSPEKDSSENNNA